jgi:LuxR family transcriptional activator of bioluminescence operon
MDYGKYGEIVDALSRADSVDGIHEQCAALSETCGFDLFQYGTIIPDPFSGPKVIIISGYPPAWLGRYLEQGYMGIDPIVTHCCSKVVGIDWERTRHLEDEDRTIREFMGESREFGLQSGISFPVHSPGGEVAILSLASSCRGHDRAKSFIDTLVPFAHQAAFHVHEAVKRVVHASVLHSPEAPLTEREKDCLLWSAEGKTSWETAKILGISERTVKFHLRNACVKLHAGNRTQAIARAVSLGLIRLST